MQTRPIERPISFGSNHSRNNSVRTLVSRRFSVKQVASVNAPPKPTTSWYCWLGLIVTVFAPALGALDHAIGASFTYFLVASVVTAVIEPAGESLLNACSAVGRLAATAPAAEILRKSRR